MNNQKTAWNKPAIESLDNKQVEENITVSACSRYDDCWPGGGHIESVPGKPPVDM